MSTPINLTSANLEDPQIVYLRLDGRSVAGVSGTVGSVPASLRKVLARRPELIDAELEVVTEIGKLQGAGLLVEKEPDGL